MGGVYQFPLINTFKTMVNLKDNLQKLNVKLRKTNRLAFVIIITLTLFTEAYILSYVFGYFRDSDITLINFPDQEKTPVMLFFSSVILIPLLETFLNQFLPYFLLNKVRYLHERSYLILLMSAIFFGGLHFYSMFYIIFGFLLGLVFMYGYMVRIKSDNKTFYLIAATHSLFNLGIFIIKLFET
jgi:uncharacterized protein